MKVEPILSAFLRSTHLTAMINLFYDYLNVAAAVLQQVAVP